MEKRLDTRVTKELKTFGDSLKATTEALQALSTGLRNTSSTNQREATPFQSRSTPVYQPAFEGNCFNCGKAGHRVSSCCHPRHEAMVAANVAEFRNRGGREPNRAFNRSSYRQRGPDVEQRTQVNSRPFSANRGRGFSRGENHLNY